MGDKDPSHRRAGDDTRARVDELAGGWSVPGKPAAPDPEPPPPAPAKKSAGPPPPPPPRAKRPSPSPPPPPRPPVSTNDETTAREPKIELSSLDDRDDATRVDPRAPEIRSTDDATGDATGDATVVAPGAAASAASKHAPTGSVRAIASLPRKRGLGGDVTYVATVLFGITRSKRELARLELELATAAARRKKRLIELAARVMADDEIRHRGVAEARERLAEIEEERARQAGQGAAAEAEGNAARRQHGEDVKRLTAEVAAIEAEVAELTTKLAPLEREATVARKQAVEVKSTLDRIAGKIDATKASLVTVKGPRGDRAAVEAELATLQADRTAVQRDEPKIAAELDALLPRIAELEARRTAARGRLERSRTELTATAEQLTERLGVVGAHMKVIERALATSQAARDNALAELGETLVLDRPRALARELVDIEELDVAIGTDERRVMELREVLGSVDRKALARGIAVLALATLAIGAFVAWILTR